MRRVLLPPVILTSLVACGPTPPPADGSPAEAGTAGPPTDEPKEAVTKSAQKKRNPDAPRTSADVPPEEAERIAKNIACKGTKCTVKAAFLAELPGDPEAMGREVRSVRMIKDGKTSGYKFFGIRPGSIPNAFGLDNGDVVTAINGEPVRSEKAAADLYTALRETKKMTIEYERKGQPARIVVTVR